MPEISDTAAASEERCKKFDASLLSVPDMFHTFANVIGPLTWNWKNPEVLELLKNMMAIDPDDIDNSLKENDVVVLKFASDTYKRIYG